MSNVIVIPGDFPRQIEGSPHLDKLREYGRVEVYSTRPENEQELLERVKDATCIINSRGTVKWPGNVLSLLPKLKMITVCGIGTDSVDLETARQCGILVCNVPGATSKIVAEHALALMFSVARKTAFFTQRLREGKWGGPPISGLQGKTLGVVGAGAIGSEVIRLGRALGMEVLAWTFHPSSERARKLGIEFVDLDFLLSHSDVVSLHVQGSPETRGLIGATQISRMKRGAFLINTARGSVVDAMALFEALQAGTLGGAGLDVFEKEPLAPDHALLKCENVVLTPHNADQTPEGIELLNRGVVENVIAFLKGSPIHRVN